MNRKLLFYGGAFDPPHKGHERLLEAAVQELDPDIALIIPTGVSPHKKRSATPFWTRFEMCSVFRRYSDRLKISALERRGHRCYTIETIKRLRKRYPDHDLYMLIGSDMLPSFHTWHLYRRIMAGCTIVAGCRDDADEAAFNEAAERLKKEGGKFVLLRFEPVEISSTQLRRTLAEGGDASEYLSEEALRVIGRKGLYR